MKISNLNIIAFLVFLIYLSYYFFQSSVIGINNITEAVNSARQIIFINRTVLSYPGLSLSLFVVFLHLSFRFVVVKILLNNERYKKIIFFENMLFNILFFVLIALIIISTIYSLDYYTGEAKEAGYQPCPSYTLLGTSLTVADYTRDIKLCYDKEVQDIVFYGSPDESFEVEKMLQERHQPK